MWAEAALTRGDRVAATARSTAPLQDLDVTEEQARAEFETNFFGASVVRAVLPILRAQRCGHIVQLSSVAGLASWPMLGLYHAT
ncbi:SDR family NAD(P)-dependent oxidoreductase [Streptomyces sp. NPDC059278]|uniref:SDR family NAD(P)-dependent oxidoreductase n=1 Tax=Streptomyces sp. NPDC059278 TaxID=3346801 RepID=UPI0036A3714C